MKSILISLLFFFGPVLLMFALRYFGLLLRIWLLWRRQKQQGKDVIDITPRTPRPPSLWFIIFAIAAGLAVSTLVWHRLTDEGQRAGTYIPAHINSHGTFVPENFRDH